MTVSGVKGRERGVKGTIDLAMFSKAEGIVLFTPADGSRLTPSSLPFTPLLTLRGLQKQGERIKKQRKATVL